LLITYKNFSEGPATINRCQWHRGMVIFFARKIGVLTNCSTDLIGDQDYLLSLWQW
jgi:hypothetical protein